MFVFALLSAITMAIILNLLIKMRVTNNDLMSIDCKICERRILLGNDFGICTSYDSRPYYSMVSIADYSD